ncbi:MAG: WbuC family cupin fold metalloprotein [Sulfuricella sp.]|nr:WbuC family cupin fold metalloprotein [Sulfuricella sp.]
MKRIDRQLLTSLSAQAAAAPRLRAHHNLHPELDDPVQRLCIAMEPGTYVRPHRHSDPASWEILLVLSGAVVLLVFDEDGRVTERTELSACGEVGTVEIPAHTWHAVASTQPGTVVFEVKQGPYKPIAEANYAPWSPADGDAARALTAWYGTARPGDAAPKS